MNKNSLFNQLYIDCVWKRSPISFVLLDIHRFSPGEIIGLWWRHYAHIQKVLTAIYSRILNYLSLDLLNLTLTTYEEERRRGTKRNNWCCVIQRDKPIKFQGKKATLSLHHKSTQLKINYTDNLSHCIIMLFDQLWMTLQENERSSADSLSGKGIN